MHYSGVHHTLTLEELDVGPYCGEVVLPQYDQDHMVINFGPYMNGPN